MINILFFQELINKQEQPITEKKLNVTFTIEKNLYEQFKKVAQKDMRKYSNIVEGSIRRYISSRT